MELFIFIAYIPFGLLAGFAIVLACTGAEMALEELFSARDGKELSLGITVTLIYLPLSVGIVYVFILAATKAAGVCAGIVWCFWLMRFPSFLFGEENDVGEHNLTRDQTLKLLKVASKASSIDREKAIMELVILHDKTIKLRGAFYEETVSPAPSNLREQLELYLLMATLFVGVIPAVVCFCWALLGIMKFLTDGVYEPPALVTIFAVSFLIFVRYGDRIQSPYERWRKSSQAILARSKEKYPSIDTLKDFGRARQDAMKLWESKKSE